MKKPIQGMASPLVSWYKQHERDFPWRSSPSPYRVWVSEIMLQQTRIEAALPYFERFMETLPTIRDLANASEDVLLKLWEGLGYYSRVRNLQKAARIVVERYNGELPDSYEELLTLPGIGEYTAGAIASIAFGKPTAAVDGNVLRVMARLLDDDTDVMLPRNRKRLTQIVQSIVPEQDPGAFTQGIMELGETICLPNTQPRCSCCPLNDYCAVAGLERARLLPIRTPPKPRRIEHKTVWIIITDESKPHVLLHRRGATGLLGGMWELPNTPDNEPIPSEWGILPKVTESLQSAKHIFSHVEWHMKATRVTANPFTPADGFVLVTKSELANYALPTAFREYSQLLPQWL